MTGQEKQWLLQEKYDGVESEVFHADLERLHAGEPLGYIIGHVPFLDCQIHLDSHPLIPRPETEYWVEKAITTMKEIISSSLTRRNLKVLDLCSGSGAIGVAVAKAVPEARVTFAEIDPTHLPTIQKNIESNVQTSEESIRMDRFKVVESNLFENVEGKFDFILTNPPYIDSAIDRAEESVKNHEPHLALYGGASGMEIINRIIDEAPNYLNEGGQLWIEHEPEQVEAIQQSTEAAGFRSVTHKDQYGVERFSVLNIVDSSSGAR